MIPNKKGLKMIDFDNAFFTFVAGFMISLIVFDILLRLGKK